MYNLAQQPGDKHRIDGLEKIIGEMGLKPGLQPYSFHVAGETISGTNVYGLLQGPRADATEAMVLMAAWRNFDGELNYSGVALALAIARYFKRWSIWSKDIILLIPEDSTYGPEAWVSAYHSTSTEPTLARNISALPIKSGALQGAVALDYPVGPWGKRFAKLDVLYDGINGALPNLDLLNTAVSVANGQMGMGCSLHGITDHSDKYSDRLKCLAKGVMTQAAGHATGPHSAFMPYHVDAITLKTVGDGWHDEMSLGRVTESVFRSVNNLLEKLHQSFFFYILLNTNRFVSIGSYLPAAMLIAGSFTINALALWILSGRGPVEPPAKPATNEKAKETPMVAVKQGGDVALVPKLELESVERKMFVPAITVLGVHLFSVVPLYLLTHTARGVSSTPMCSLRTKLTLLQNITFAFISIAAASYILPIYLSVALVRILKASSQQLQVMQSFSLLFIGATLSTWATINFSLALLVGILASPLCFARPVPFSNLIAPKTEDKKAGVLNFAIRLPAALVWLVASPPTALYAISWYSGKDLSWILIEIAKGWLAQGVWSNLVIWSVWWPAWVLGGVVLFSGVVQ